MGVKDVGDLQGRPQHVGLSGGRRSAREVDAQPLERALDVADSKPRTLRNDLLPELKLQTLAICDLKMPKHVARKLDPGHIKESPMASKQWASPPRC
jgi:hypothetical protein